ncbi:MAG: hypothetical protein JWM85_2344 [Acidimicrobiaceae bacterium]|nr:hypothetical protein [Acidimicrobiaceae bacterium]
MAEDDLSTARDDGDWVSKVTHAVESFVVLVRDHSLRPVLTALRFAALGFVAACLGLVIAVLGVIALVRLLTADAFGGRVWASDLVVGGILAGAGGLLLLMAGRVGKDEISV